MPYLRRSDDCNIYYEIDDWTDPWTHAEPVLFIHGFTESVDSFRGWVPHLSRRYRLIRVDLRGFGKTGPVPSDFNYTTDLFVDDLVYCIEKLAGEPVHVISAKSGGISSVRLISRRPDLVRTATFAYPPVVPPPKTENWISTIDSKGMRAWAHGTMRARMGSKMPGAGIEWWSDLMGATAVSTAHAYLRWVSALTPAEIRADVKKIACPTLMIGSHTPSDRPLSEFEQLAPTLPNVEYTKLDIEGYHASGADPDTCAKMAFDFMQRHTSSLSTRASK